MRKLRDLCRVCLPVLFVAVISLALSGCGDKAKDAEKKDATDTKQKSDHPTGDHPKGDHPTGDKADHPK